MKTWQFHRKGHHMKSLAMILCLIISLISLAEDLPLTATNPIQNLTSGESPNAASEACKSETHLRFVWETPPSFRTPEAVLYDPQRDVLYVSNYNVLGGFTSSGDRSPNEFISRVSTDGQILELEWIQGLISPTGMDIYRDKLYVVERGALVEIDIESAKIVNRYEITGSLFTNDVVFDSNGIGYISDNNQNATITIYRFIDGKIEPWQHRNQIYRANGLCLYEGQLLGSDYNNPYLQGVDLAIGQLKDVAYTSPAGVLFDGLAQINEHVLLGSDWAGQVYLLYPPDVSKQILDVSQLTPVSGSRVNSADFGYIPSKKMIVIPTFMDNRLIAYELLE